MTSVWGSSGRRVAYNVEVYGIPNAAQQARIDAGEVLSTYWNGEMQTRPYGPSDPVKFAQRLKDIVPWVNTVRFPFNQHSWDSSGNFLDYNEQFLAECKNQGLQILFPLMDGPSWQDPVIESNLLVDWLDHMNNVVHVGQMAGHAKLIAWMQARAATRPVVWGVEAINEPQMYHLMELATRDTNQAVTLYVQHVLDIFELWRTAFPDVQFGVDGWLYANSLLPLDSYLPDFGMSGTDAIRAAVGGRIFWSLHLNPDFDYDYSVSRFGTAKGRDRVMLTETHTRGNHADAAPPNKASDTITNYLFAANGDFWAKYDVGLGWWTGANYAKSRLMAITGTGNATDVNMLFFGSYSAYLHVASYGAHQAFFTGPEMGLKTPALKTVAKVFNPGDDDAQSPYSSFATAFGGRGVCVIQGLNNTNNSLHGGDGWNVLYGATTAGDDHLYLGRGGGVVRTYQGENRIVGPSHSTGLIYTGTGKDVITLNGSKSATTVIINPSQGECWIWDFDPIRAGASAGDRISFKGTFADAAALRDACTVALAERYMGNAGLIDLKIALPAGGYVVLQGGAALIETLGQYCRDFTEGWYRAGWSEPADYDPALLTVDPGPNLTDWYADDGDTVPGDGGPVPIFNRFGQQVLIQTRGGAIAQVA